MTALRQLTLVLALMTAPALAGCATPRQYVRIAEGLSSASVTEGIQVVPRMFSAPQLAEACRTADPVARLRVEPSRLELAPGNVYSLDSLTVVAINRADEAIPGTPIILEAEDTNPPVLQLRSDDPDLNAGRVRVIGSGRFRLRVRTTCGLPASEAIVEARVGE